MEHMRPTLKRLPSFADFPARLEADAHDGPYRAICAELHDGDTYRFFVWTGFTTYTAVDVRLWGANAPELSTPEGQAALEFVDVLMPPGTQVLLTPERDFVMSFARFVCRVTLPDSSDLAAVLVQAGHAVPEDG